MKRVPSLATVLFVAIIATIIVLGVQRLIGKSAATIAIGPATAIVLAILISRQKTLR